MNWRKGFTVICSLCLAFFIVAALRSDGFCLWRYGYRAGEILGSAPAELEAAYGPFDRVLYDENGAMTRAEFCLRPNTPEMIMGRDDSLWLCIVFEDQIAMHIHLREGQIGG